MKQMFGFDQKGAGFFVLRLYFDISIIYMYKLWAWISHLIVPWYRKVLNYFRHVLIIGINILSALEENISDGVFF